MVVHVHACGMVVHAGAAKGADEREMLEEKGFDGRVMDHRSHGDGGGRADGDARKHEWV